MKCCIIKLLNSLLLFVPVCAMAGWEIANPETTVPREPYFQPGTKNDRTPLLACGDSAALPKQYIVPAAPPAVIEQPRQAGIKNHRLLLAADSRNAAYRRMAFPNKYFSNRYAVPVQPRIPYALSAPPPPSALYAVSISGSLKENIERIMGRYHWKVIWKAPYDYNFDGRITGSSLPNVVEKLLQPFPLQAVMYMSNRTITIVPRYKA